MGLLSMIDSPITECRASGFTDLEWNAEQGVWEIPANTSFALTQTGKPDGQEF